MKIQQHLHWLIYPLFFLACARQTAPTGGPKDTIPPILISTLPKHEALNYKGKTVELNFNEAIITNNPKDQILIIPSVGKDFEATAKKDRLVLTFKEDLKDSTTYSINFRDGVQDITEKNPAKNLKLAFSTGNYIDSLSIEGYISDPLRGKESKEATVALYEADTFNIFKHKPSYLTKTSEKGIYKLENLKPGEYYVYAIEDKNKNLVIDSKSESYGFLKDKIRLDSNASMVNIPLVRLDNRPLKLTNYRPYNTYFNIKTSKNLASFKLTPQEDEILLSSFGDDLANIKVFNTIEDKDSLAVRLEAYDSVNHKIDTTLYIKFGKRDAKPEAFKSTAPTMRVIGTKGILHGTIGFNKPLAVINFDSIFYQIDSAKIVPIKPEDVHIDSLHNIVTIEKTFDKVLLKKPEPPKDLPKKADQPKLQTQPPAPATAVKQPGSGQKKPAPPKLVDYQFVTGKGAFISAELDSSKSLQTTVRPSTLEETGVILVQVNTKAEHYVVELLNRDFKVVDKKRDNKKITFEDVEPGEYMLRLIIDKNGDGLWNPGNYELHEEPEPITFYKNEKNLPSFNLKANWELGPLLITY
ncbi:Ig-like domain-containing protein [Chryseolinea lacunae]|uniref:Ig-like domain-containing protein n=1 Tax=Chryseolinea lacunae TaxID=2801331 RepID=A0ABS1KR91_9BACT|nr:Ig-like domain-containing protein [Chryseolinea lacunae]MBL0741767.1 Ig-like domain-containing protein [Chryseolinea lacunae]